MPVLEHPHPSEEAEATPDPGEFMPLTVWLIYEHAQWYALAEEFDVAGMGSSPEGAIENMTELLMDYLRLAESEGKSVREARRPIPLSRKIRLRALARYLHASHIARVHRQRFAERLRVPFEPLHC